MENKNIVKRVFMFLIPLIIVIIAFSFLVKKNYKPQKTKLTSVEILDVAAYPMDTYQEYVSEDDQQIYEVVLHLKNNGSQNIYLQYLSVFVYGKREEGTILNPVDYESKMVDTKMIPMGLDAYKVEYIMLPKTEEKIVVENYEFDDTNTKDETEYVIADILQ